MSTRTTARGRRFRGARIAVLLVLVATLAIAAVVVGRRLFRKVEQHLVVEQCTVGSFTLDPSQAAVASTMVGEVRKYRIPLPERASVLVLAAALQESKLVNIPPGQGDRDSVGVLQQRPSQGWGSGIPDTIAARTRRLTDVAEATKEFLDALVQIDGWQRLALATAIQRVQVSADGSAYAQHGPTAQALADALTGAKAAAINCEFAAPTVVASAPVVAAQARNELGISTPVADAHTVRVPGAHWQTAAWFVANADRLGIEQVDYAGRRWSRGNGWTSRAGASAAAVVATMYRR